jgi:hypothetical protein
LTLHANREYAWAKVYLELPADPKLTGRSAHDCYLWVCLILLAKVGDGLLPLWQSQASYLAKYARIPLKEAVAALAYFEDVGMIALTPDGGIHLPQFPKRQKRKDSDSPEMSRERKRMSRAGHANVTPLSRESHATRDLREEAEADTEVRGQTINAVDWELGSENTHPLNPPRRVPETAASPAALCVSGFDEWWTELTALTKGHPGDKAEAGRRWNTEVPPGSEADTLAALKAYGRSDQVQRGVVMKGTKFLGEWQQWLPQHGEQQGPHEEVRYGPKGEEIRVMVP